MTDEAVAGAILEKVLGVSVAVVDTGKISGSHDLELVRDGVSYGCVEVTSTVVGDIAALRNTLKKQGRSLPAPELSYTWSLSLGRKPPLRNFKRHRDLLIRVLLEIEAAGKMAFSMLRPDEQHPRLPELRATFGVWHGHALDNLEECESEILLGEAPSGGAYGVTHIVKAIERETAKEDNLRKLRNCSLPKRHFFLFIDADTDVGTRLAMDLPATGMAEMPAPPRLPEEIQETVVWAATWVGDGAYRVWRCVPGQRWQDLGGYSVQTGVTRSTLEICTIPERKTCLQNHFDCYSKKLI